MMDVINSLQLIEKIRAEIHVLYKNGGLTDEVLKKSQRLDEVLNDYEKHANDKKALAN
jgi:hypothetical protein